MLDLAKVKLERFVQIIVFKYLRSKKRCEDTYFSSLFFVTEKSEEKWFMLKLILPWFDFCFFVSSIHLIAERKANYALQNACVNGAKKT